MLFTATELRALLGRPVTDDQYDLAYDLAEDAILGEIGSRLTEPPQRGVKSVALAIAARSLTNASGVRSEQAGAIAVTYADSETGRAMTDDERRRLRRAVGMAPGAGMLCISPPDVGTQVDLRWGWW
ncbi:hypothetical protein [Streptomyces sp. NPDC006638]|uniref:hypothetical protein n=1 Tax=Streptomyces sp. NPDC006638 TaxID=3157183 RepID=UPI0033AC5F98